MLDLKIVGIQELVVRFTDAATTFAPRMLAAMDRSAQLVQDTASERMGELFSNPSTMQSSLSHTVEGGGNSIIATISASGLPYLAAQEYGTTFTMPPIFPVNASVLAWADRPMFNRGGGITGTVFAASTKAHPTTIPERSYMRYALATVKQQVADMLAEEAGKI